MLPHLLIDSTKQHSQKSDCIYAIVQCASQRQQLRARIIRYHCNVVINSALPSEHDSEDLHGIYASALGSVILMPDPYSVCDEPP